MAPGVRRSESAVFARRLASSLRDIVLDMSNVLMSKEDDRVTDKAMRAYSLGFAAAVIRKQAEELEDVARDMDEQTQVPHAARPN